MRQKQRICIQMAKQLQICIRKSWDNLWLSGYTVAYCDVIDSHFKMVVAVKSLVESVAR